MACSTHLPQVAYGSWAWPSVSPGPRRPFFPPLLRCLLLFAIFNILLARTIFTWVERWLAQRRTREILGVIFLFVIISFQFIGPLVRHLDRSSQPAVSRIVLSALCPSRDCFLRASQPCPSRKLARPIRRSLWLACAGLLAYALVTLCAVESAPACAISRRKSKRSGRSHFRHPRPSRKFARGLAHSRCPGPRFRRARKGNALPFAQRSHAVHARNARCRAFDLSASLQENPIAPAACWVTLPTWHFRLAPPTPC